MDHNEAQPERRSFLTGLNAGAAALATLALSGAAGAQTAAPFKPAMHDKDNWLEIPSKHRLIFDTTTPKAAGEALLFARNFLMVNKSDYGLEASDFGIVIVVRHDSVSFAYNDVIWAKYGSIISDQINFKDPVTGAAPKLNVYNVKEYGMKAVNFGVTQDSLAKQGMQLAACQMATRALAGAIAKATDQKADDVVKEITSNLVANARMVSAGILVVPRAQERGYALVSV